MNDYLEVYRKAKEAGAAALEKCRPTPMVVQQHADMLNDNSPVVKQYFVAGGVCGFAWVNIKYKGEGVKFLNSLKKAKIAGSEEDRRGHELYRDTYYGGYSFWVHDGGQSMELKEAYARAFAGVLREADIPCQMMSRMD